MRFQKGELIEAQAEAHRAYLSLAQQSPERADRFRVLEAEILIWRGMSKKALDLLDRNLPTPLATDETAVRRKLAQGLANGFLSRYAEAESCFNEAERLALKNQPYLLGEVALDKGTVLLRRNRPSEAKRAFHEALQIAREQSQLFLEASAQVDLGFIAMNEQHYGEASDWFQSSLALSKSLGARSLVAKVTGNLGWCYYRMGDLDTALKLSAEAEALSAQLGLQRDELEELINAGLIHFDRKGVDSKELQEAQSDYLRALSMAKQLENRPDSAICLNNLALIAIEKKQFDEAERYNREAYDLERTDSDPTSRLHYLYNEAMIAAGRGNSLQAKALLEQVINDSDQNFYLGWTAQSRLANIYAILNEPSLADQQFRKSLAGIHEARSSLNREEYRLSFISSLISFYDDYIAFLVGRGEIQEALRVAELSRAQTLSEGLGLKEDSGSFLSANFRPEATARQMRAAILSYWLASERSYLWIVTSSRVELFQLPPQSEIEQAVRSYRSALAGARDVRETGNANGQKLYQTLVAPADKLIPRGARVIIIPDGGLYELNFETLLVPGDPLHYWIEDVVVANASSLLLLQSGTRSSQPDRKNLLLIGDPVPTSAQYTTLPQAASEIGQIKTYFPANKVQLYEGQQATPKAYLQGDPGRFSLIHFVAHGVASRQSPLDSAVILSGDESSYKLYAREIVKVPLRARLVTISSCEGARGRTYAGEGLVGLSWAFLRAGAHQVIAALWEVNDAATPEFMHNFYAGISAGSEPAVALRTAKLAMLHSDTIYRRPFYWAPFQLYQGR